MKFDCSYTCIRGLTVSLSVSGPESFWQHGSEDALSHLENSDLASLFEACLPEICQQLVAAHDRVSQVLLCSFVDLNRNILNGMMPEEDKEAA